MTAPDITTLTAVVLAQNAVYHTRHAAVFEQIKNYVWNKYRSASDIKPTVTWADVGGCGAAIYAEFISKGFTSAIGGVAFWLEQLSNNVLTYPYTRASNNVLNVPTS